MTKGHPGGAPQLGYERVQMGRYIGQGSSLLIKVRIA